MAEQKDLLIEIGTEELPPKALPKLSAAFMNAVMAGLEAAGLGHLEIEPFAAPRRLALLVRSLDLKQADREVEKRGPAVKAAYDADGNPTKAALGFASSCGVEITQLGTLDTDKGAWLVFRSKQAGKPAAELIPGIVGEALDRLPIPKRMRWGDSEAQFVRPVHWIVMMLGNDVIPAELLGVQTSNTTYGHRFHHPQEITLYEPASYAELLEERGHVIANFAKRRDKIRAQVNDCAAAIGGAAVVDAELLDEVTALVEWPVALAGRFEEKFLEVPHEALISTMEDNQKYFAVVSTDGRLQPYFITVANIESRDPARVIEGNERVIRPRFADAAFFWEQDRKQTLASRIDKLKDIVFQQKLGTLYDKSLRVQRLAEAIAEEIGGDVEYAGRAALLAKCDLLSDMVGEFPKIQGIAGRYFATHDGEAPEVAEALEEQYLPRQAGDALPVTHTGQALAIADKLDTLAGIFGIGQKPTGTKDPFALRRSALGILRIIIESELDLDLYALLKLANAELADRISEPDNVEQCFAYMLERLRAYYQDQGVSSDVIDAVMALQPARPFDFHRRIEAVSSFRQLEAAQSLAAANKRIGNILKKAEDPVMADVNEALLTEAAEKALYTALTSVEKEVSAAYDQAEYEAALTRLAGLREPVDDFFDHVMVMVDDAALKENRLALLSRLHGLFLRAADLSVLQ
ncbi:MAG: glycine--tRNA ligase subunit beta [Thiotrichales bacterium]